MCLLTVILFFVVWKKARLLWVANLGWHTFQILPRENHESDFSSLCRGEYEFQRRKRSMILHKNERSAWSIVPCTLYPVRRETLLTCIMRAEVDKPVSLHSLQRSYNVTDSNMIFPVIFSSPFICIVNADSNDTLFLSSHPSK